MMAHTQQYARSEYHTQLAKHEFRPNLRSHSWSLERGLLDREELTGSLRSPESSRQVGRPSAGFTSRLADESWLVG